MTRAETLRWELTLPDGWIAILTESGDWVLSDGCPGRWLHKSGERSDHSEPFLTLREAVAGAWEIERQARDEY